MKERGFTLLEVLVATLIMGIAVVTLLSSVSTSLRNAARLSDYDRAVVLGRAKMDELLADFRLPRNSVLTGSIDAKLLSGAAGGWQARATPFERAPNAGAGGYGLERIELEIWWARGDNRRSYRLESYRPFMLKPQDVLTFSGEAAP